MTKLDKIFLIIGALALMTTGVLGAIGVHGLPDTLTEADRLSWRWGVQIQAYNSFSMILVTLLAQNIGSMRLFDISRVLFVASIIIFSGSIYLEKLSIISVAAGDVAPIGGSSFMLGWLLVAVAVFLKK